MDLSRHAMVRGCWQRRRRTKVRRRERGGEQTEGWRLRHVAPRTAGPVRHEDRP